MVMTNKVLVDSYQHIAGLYPALLALAPAIVYGLVLYLDEFSFAEFAVAAFSSGGSVFLLSQFSRDCGKKREHLLFQKWGGMPSVTIFRHRDQRLDAITKKNCHVHLAKLVKGTSAPTQSKETDDTEGADAIYLAWSTFIRANTYDKNTFYFLHKESIHYGYRRNVWGLRLIGIIFSLAVAILCLIQNYTNYKSAGYLLEDMVMIGVVAFGFFALWLFHFRENWVKISADAYAARLVECTDTLFASQKEKT